MALRKFMHPRNKYKEGADFKRLAVLYPEFCKQTTTDLSGKLRYNFKNDESLRILTKTLLKHDFDLEVEIPDEKLVPAMPLRLNYILWIEDLVVHANLSQFGDVHGIDIGTGAVCIYPLLCAKIYGWKMTSTEINESSVLSANENISKNCLDHLIKVIKVKDEESILTKVLKESDSYSFTMCNPPFFNMDKICKKKKRQPPRNATTGNDEELHVVGGEKSFVTRIIDESLVLRERIKIYTTMLGHKSSCKYFRSELKRRNIENATWTEFCQGHTKRWGLAWTFLSKEIVDLTIAPSIKAREEIRASEGPKKRPCEMIFPLGDKFHSLDDLIGSLKLWIQELKIEIKDLDIPERKFDGWTGQLRAYEDSWTHGRRKRRIAEREQRLAKKIRLGNVKMKKNDENITKSEKSQESTPGSSEPLLECTLIVGEFEKEDSEKSDLVKFHMIYENGPGGKDAMETLRQYFENKLEIRDFLSSQNRDPSTRKKKKRRKGKRTDRSVSELKKKN